MVWGYRWRCKGGGRKRIDLLDRKFGNLTVIRAMTKKKNGRVQWWCRCDCGNELAAISSELIQGTKKRCGDCSKNTFTVQGDVCFGYLSDGREFVFDTEFLPLVKKHTWSMYADGSVTAHASGEQIYLHRFLMNPKNDEDINHRNRNKSDNRLCNLRISDCSLSQFYKKMMPTNTSGYRDVCWDRTKKKWRVRIKVNGKSIHFGYYHHAFEAGVIANYALLLIAGEFAWRDETLPEPNEKQKQYVQKRVLERCN